MMFKKFENEQPFHQLPKQQQKALIRTLYLFSIAFSVLSLAQAAYLGSNIENKLLGAGLVIGVLLMDWAISSNVHKLLRRAKFRIRYGQIMVVVDFEHEFHNRQSTQRDATHPPGSPLSPALLVAVKSFVFTFLSGMALGLVSFPVSFFFSD